MNKDLEFVKEVLKGDEKACKQFTEDFSDWVLYKVWDLAKSYCNYSPMDYVCCLNLLHQERKGGYSFSGDEVHCDDCMDSYIWFFDYLKQRLNAYKGINNCSLRTYVWSILNSPTTRIDWIRWKYGRATIPSSMKELNSMHQQIYLYLRQRKSEEKISKLLNISLEEVKSKAERIRESLIKEGQLYLIEDPQFLSIHAINPDDPDSQELPLAADEIPIDEKLIKKELLSHLKDVINRLPQYQARLLRLRYNHEMTAKEILEFIKKMKINLIPDKEIKELKEQDIFYALKIALQSVLKGLKEKYGRDIFEEIEL